MTLLAVSRQISGKLWKVLKIHKFKIYSTLSHDLGPCRDVDQASSSLALLTPAAWDAVPSPAKNKAKLMGAG